MYEPSLLLPSIHDGEDKSSALKNRIRKNYRHIRKWATRSMTNCFRIYDRDIKEYPLAIDFYAGRFCVQFFSYNRNCDEPPSELKTEVEQTLYSIFGTSASFLYWRTRLRRKKIEQYEKVDHQEKFFTVYEYGIKFRVNLDDYLDTGLFLDHRETRRRVASMAKGKRLLNLFCYTCSFSIHAALAGASFTKSVDLSNTYTGWGYDNFMLNSIPLHNNDIVRADCMKFLDDEILARTLFDIIVIDPPTLSRSKKMDQLFDVQVDYSTLITKALYLLMPGGVIFFSTNSRKFKFDSSLFSTCCVEEISEKTLPHDFHNKKVHRCWKITPELTQEG